VRLGYYAQHVAESLDPNSTVINEMVAYSHPQVTRQEGLNMAGLFYFQVMILKENFSTFRGRKKAELP